MTEEEQWSAALDGSFPLKRHPDMSIQDHENEKQIWAWHQRLLKSTMELANEDHPPSTDRAFELADTITKTQKEIDTYWSKHEKEEAIEKAKRDKEKEVQRQELKDEVRERYVAAMTEAYADDLDELRRDPAFKGTNDDMQMLVDILADGIEHTLLSADEDLETDADITLSLYRDYLGCTRPDGPTSAEGSVLNGQAQILDEPVQAEVQRNFCNEQFEGNCMMAMAPYTSPTFKKLYGDEREREGKGQEEAPKDAGDKGGRGEEALEKSDTQQPGGIAKGLQGIESQPEVGKDVEEIVGEGDGEEEEEEEDEEEEKEQEQVEVGLGDSSEGEKDESYDSSGDSEDGIATSDEVLDEAEEDGDSDGMEGEQEEEMETLSSGSEDGVGSKEEEPLIKVEMKETGKKRGGQKPYEEAGTVSMQATGGASRRGTKKRRKA